MKQLINSTSTPDWPGIEVEYNIPIDLFIDNFVGYDPKRNSFKILWVKEAESISKFRTHAIANKHLFDAIISYDHQILSECENSFFLEFGTSWIKDYDLSKEKKFQVSHLTGFKEMTDGHLLRKKVHYKQDRIKIPIDFYISNLGGVDNHLSNKILGDKKDELFDSQFHICIENSIQKSYFTEKLIDCFVTKTIPIYYGCQDIDDFFDIGGILVANSFNEIVSQCNNLSPDFYQSRADHINNNFELSKKYITIVDRLANLINKIIKNENFRATN